MKKQAAAASLLMALLIIDSRCACTSAAKAVELCVGTLIPSLFPLFVVSAVALPCLDGLKLGWLSRLLGMPAGSEGIFLLGCAGGFPMGADAIAGACRNGALGKKDAERMLGFCSFCGPAFLFGVAGNLLSVTLAAVLFLIQLETAFLIGAFSPGRAAVSYRPDFQPVTLPAAVRRSVSSMATVCSWVILAGVVSGLMGKWLFPLLPDAAGILVTGLMELTNGVVLAAGTPVPLIPTAVFVCFGGVSVLLQIAGLVSPAGLSIRICVLQKAIQGMVGGLLAAVYIRYGPWVLLVPPALVFLKLAVEIPKPMVYNTRRKEGI